MTVLHTNTDALAAMMLKGGRGGGRTAKNTAMSNAKAEVTCTRTHIVLPKTP